MSTYVSLSSAEDILAYDNGNGRKRMEGRIVAARKMPMETAEILNQFERATGRFARAAVEAAVARQEEITPELLRILEETVDRAVQLDAEGYRLRVPVYCLMTNDVHVVAVPEHESSLAKVLGRLLADYSRAVNFKRRRCRHLWQERFYLCAPSGRLRGTKPDTDGEPGQAAAPW
jgi:Protein of unknown function (DUF1186)